MCLYMTDIFNLKVKSTKTLAFDNTTTYFIKKIFQSLSK